MDVKELIGVTLGTCTLERVIGRGGMGAVYLAQQSRPVRTVAVKILIPAADYDFDQRRIFLERFRREADTVAKLEHKNILPIYEYEEAIVDGVQLAYLVMPYVRGGTLRNRMDEMNREGREFDLRDVVNYITQIAEALDYAHGFGVVHRDVKPANLLFHQDGRLMLSDFGIVRLEAQPALTSIGSFIGTAEYASPEQINSKHIDTRSDIYSLGIILYELLMSHAPFTGSNPFVVMTQQLNDPVPPLSKERPDLSNALESVVMKALEKDPANRYQSARALASDLRAAVSFQQSSLMLGEETVDSDDLTEAGPSWSPFSSSPDHGQLVYSAQDGYRGSRAAVADPHAHGQPYPNPYVNTPERQSSQDDQDQQMHRPWVQLLHARDSRLNPGVGSEPGSRQYHPGRRLGYYTVALVMLIFQFPILYMLFGPSTAENQSSFLPLGLLLGAGLDLFCVATLTFIGVTMQRPIQRQFWVALAVALPSPLLAGLFVGFGQPESGNIPALAYVLSLVGNIICLRQLALIDVQGEPQETVPLQWRPLLIGALSGLLPLIIILFFAFATPPVLSVQNQNPPLFNMMALLFVVLLGAPTPGAVLIVSQANKITFPALVRSSGLAGAIMFVAAFALVIIWGILFSREHQLFYLFATPWLAMIAALALLSLMGLLRGMFDAWVCRLVIQQSSRPRRQKSKKTR